MELKAASTGDSFEFFDPHDDLQCHHQTPCSLFHPDNLHLTVEGYDLLDALLKKFSAQDSRVSDH